MTVRRRRLLLAALAVLAAATWYRSRVFDSSTTTLSAKPRIAFVTGGSGPYWRITTRGAQAAAVEHQVDLSVHMPTDAESLEQQMKILVKFDLENFDGIAVSPLDADALTRVINRIADKTNVVTFDADAPLSERQCYVGTSNFGAGQLCAQLVAEAVPEGGKVAVLVANLVKFNLIERKSGFAESLQRTSEKQTSGPFEVVSYLLDDGSDKKCAELVRKTLAAHPDLACFVGMNARHGPVLLNVLREEDQLGNVKLVTFDEAEETLLGIEEEHIYATVAQDPYKYGYEAVRMLSTLCRGDSKELPIVGGGSVHVGVEAIRKDNLDNFRTRLKARQEEAQEDSDETNAA